MIGVVAVWTDRISMGTLKGCCALASGPHDYDVPADGKTSFLLYRALQVEPRSSTGIGNWIFVMPKTVPFP